MRKAPSAETYKLLYVRTGNECAFPACRHPIFNDDGLYIAQLCHIKAANEGGPRFDKDQTDEQRRSIDNLLFMCHRHHKETDNIEIYDENAMYEIKSNHEAQFTEEGRSLTDRMIEQIDLDSRYYWHRQKSKEFDLDDLKMKTNFELNESELFQEIQESIGLIYNYCETCANSDDADTLEKDLRSLFDKAGLEYEKIEQVPYYENPFSNRNWVYHNLGLPNLFSSLMLKLYQLRVKTFETLITLDPENEKLNKELTRYRQEFEEIYDNFYHVD